MPSSKCKLCWEDRELQDSHLVSHTNSEDVLPVLQDIGRLETRLSGEVSDELFDELEELHSAIFVDLRRRGILTPSNFEEFLPILPL